MKNVAAHIPAPTRESGSGDPVDPYLDWLRQGGVKVTPNRRKVISRFLAVDSPWTLKSLHLSLSQDEECDSSSVYRTLEALRTAGLLEEFRLPGDKQTFYALIKSRGLQKVSMSTTSPRMNTAIQNCSQGYVQADHHHHHILCQDCGKVSHLDICMPAAWLGKVENTSGFQITEHHLEFKGVCAECR